MKRLIILFSLFTIFTIHCSLFTAVKAAEPPNRIVSLAPSMTEILFALGLEHNIVGVTNFCDYPEEAKKKPKIGGMSNPSLEAVVSLKPDIVIMTTDGNPKEFEERLHSLKIKTYVFKERQLLDLPHGVRNIGLALGVKEKAESVAKEIEEAVSKYKGQGKKVLFIIWPEPLIVAGPNTLIDDAINLLGAINIAQGATASYPKYSIEEIFRQSPDVIIIGKGHEDMRKLSNRLLKRLSSVPAVRDNKVFYVSDNLYRLGPRVIEGIKELAGYLNEKQSRE
ncbi:MAG: cobalamin-binding protein [Nitrospinae bacterium]|nr:cobalamin-binding protein [Nitrospinota bacterium]